MKLESLAIWFSLWNHPEKWYFCATSANNFGGLSRRYSIFPLNSPLKSVFLAAPGGETNQTIWPKSSRPQDPRFFKKGSFREGGGVRPGSWLINIEYDFWWKNSNQTLNIRSQHENWGEILGTAFHTPQITCDKTKHNEFDQNMPDYFIKFIHKFEIYSELMLFKIKFDSNR